MRLPRWSLALVCLLCFSTVTFAEGPKIAPTYSMAQARKIALARVPGKIVHEKLKAKKKKSNQHYSIKIQPPEGKMLQKVEVDAMTGKIVKVKAVKPRDASKKGKEKDKDDD